MTSLASIALRLNWGRQDLFDDLRVRHGIKLGLAGSLALFCTQVLRLPSDNWAILTVLVLMNGKFVGAFSFKGIMRLIGTVAGAVVGIWLASDYASTPIVFLPVFFVIMAFAGYRFGQVGARQGPYAYFLLGLTTLVVAAEGVTDPEQAWQTGLDRTEEILVGIICSLLVSTLIWPRYAREEFFDAGRAALKTVGRIVSIRTLTYIFPASAPLEIHQLQDVFDRQSSHLKSLLQAGVRENAFLSAPLANYNTFTVSLTNLFHAALALNCHREEAWLFEHAQSEIQALFAAISDEFDILAGSLCPSEKLLASPMNEAFTALEGKVHRIRGQGIFLEATLQSAMDFAGEFAVLRSLRDELNNIRSAMQGLPRFGQSVPWPATCPPKFQRRRKPWRSLPEQKTHWDLLPTIDGFWVKVGIKGGLAAVIAIVSLKWIHPPGAADVPVWAWLFVVLKRTFLRAGGTGDLRGFQTAIRGSLVLVACTLLLILTTQLLANYAVMSLALFLVMFATGFFTAKIAGLSFWTQFTFLTIDAFVALNPQVPVSSQTIIDTFLGIMFGMWIATVVGRLLWPLLPQRVLRDSLLALFAQIKALLCGDPHVEKILTQLANLPVEAVEAIRQIRIAGCSKEEKAKLVALVRSIQTLICRVSELGSRKNLLPEITEEILRLPFQRLEIEFTQMLDAFADCFRQGNSRRELPVVGGALAEMDHAVQQIRDRNLLGDLPPEASLRVLDLVNRYHAIADALEECGEFIRSLQIQQYWGDYGL
jgi:hypothetical protein